MTTHRTVEDKASCSYFVHRKVNGIQIKKVSDIKDIFVGL